MKIADGQFSTNEENYKEFWYSMVGLAGEGQNFDGNGPYVRFQPGGGDQTLSMGQSGGIARQDLRQRDRAAAGDAARLPGQAPAVQLRRSPVTRTRCPNLNGAPTGPPDGGGATTRAGRVR